MKKAFKLLIPSLLLLLLVSCNNTVDGVDKDLYKKSEEYSSIMYQVIKGKEQADESLKYYTPIPSFLDDVKTNNEKERDIYKHVSMLFSIYSLANAEYETGGLTKETKEKIKEIANYLNTEYKMNID